MKKEEEYVKLSNQVVESVIDRSLLPRQLQDQLREVDEWERGLKAFAFMHPKRGPKPTKKLAPVIMFITDNEKDTARHMRIFINVVGKKVRGNKRIGKQALYADLVKYFLLLKRHGVTLPRNKSLSMKACQYCLGEILRRHNCTSLSDNLLMKSGDARKIIVDRMDRIFSHVADCIENPPA